MTQIDAADLPPGCSAGLSAFGDPNNAVGLSEGDGKLTLWRRERGTFTQLAQVDAPQAKQLKLRLIARGGFQFQFAASADGKHWITVGDDLTGKNLPPWDRSVRVALTVTGGEQAEAHFDSFRITPTAASK